MNESAIPTYTFIQMHGWNRRYYLPAQEINDSLVCAIQSANYPAVVRGNGFADEVEATVGCGAGEGGVDV